MSPEAWALVLSVCDTLRLYDVQLSLIALFGGQP